MTNTLQSFAAVAVPTLLTISLHAVDAPNGVYCSCPPTNAHSDSVVAAVGELDFVEGVLVRVLWSDIESSPGMYDWSLIDGQIQRAESYGKKISLAVVSGVNAPSWLSSLGAETLTTEFFGDPRTLPIAWDSVHTQRWTSFIEQLGARYNDEATISLVYITNSSANGFEMQLPFAPADQQNWADAGYSDALYAGSWITAIDAFASAFPDKALSYDVHPVLGSDSVAEDVYAYSSSVYGDRIGLLAAWWMVHNAEDVYPAMYELLSDAADASHAEVQVANSFTNTPERFGASGLQGEIDLAIETGVRYMEIWNSDLLNPDLSSMLANASAALTDRGCSDADIDMDDDLDVFDVFAFLDAFNAGDLAADFTGDGSLDIFDVFGFLEQFNAGCP